MFWVFFSLCKLACPIHLHDDKTLERAFCLLIPYCWWRWWLARKCMAEFRTRDFLFSQASPKPGTEENSWKISRNLCSHAGCRRKATSALLYHSAGFSLGLGCLFAPVLYQSLAYTSICTHFPLNLLLLSTWQAVFQLLASLEGDDTWHREWFPCIQEFCC